VLNVVIGSLPVSSLKWLTDAHLYFKRIKFSGINGVLSAHSHACGCFCQTGI